jgi:hypothetical protein
MDRNREATCIPPFSILDCASPHFSGRNKEVALKMAENAG